MGALGVPNLAADATAASTPSAVWGLGSGVVGLSAGSQALHVCAWSASTLWCWGYNSDGQAAAPTTDAGVDIVPTPVAVPMLNGPFTAVATGDEHTCGIANGRTYCWGSNEVGQLGVGLVSSGSSLPVEVSGR
jgi:alpha-tubulin suppressor-like RCC1 family protein